MKWVLLLVVVTVLFQSTWIAGSSDAMHVNDMFFGRMTRWPADGGVPADVVQRGLNDCEVDLKKSFEDDLSKFRSLTQMNSTDRSIINYRRSDEAFCDKLKAAIYCNRPLEASLPWSRPGSSG